MIAESRVLPGEVIHDDAERWAQLGRRDARRRRFMPPRHLGTVAVLFYRVAYRKEKGVR